MQNKSDAWGPVEGLGLEGGPVGVGFVDVKQIFKCLNTLN